MPKNATNPAESALKQQIEFCGEKAVSLDSLWRAAGQPTDRAPSAWVEIAAPLIDAFAAYSRTVGSQGPLEEARPPLVWLWDGKNCEPWRTGDLMTHAFLARLYAVYLDWLDHRGDWFI